MMFSLCLAMIVCASTGQTERCWLVRGGQSQVVIVHGRDDAYAARRLARGLSEVGGAKPDVFAAEAWKADRPGTVLLLGSAASNRHVAALAAAVGLDLAPERLTDQGYVAKLVQHAGRTWLLLAGGGADGTRYAVADLLNWIMTRRDRDAWVDHLDAREVPRLRYRWFWNWDHRMDWGGPGKPGTLMGGGGTYARPAEAFLIDCRRCIDFMADHKFNGLILWGFLRDSHGGVAASQDICRYARERGVRILPGVGTSGYAGYYFEGRHPFNADAWLAEHPEFRAVTKEGKPHNAPCPSKKANQEWLDRGAKWMFENFAVGGANLEMGDFFVCYCDECRKTRAGIASDEPDYYKDMAVSHRVTLDTMRRLSPDAWLSYATYTGYTREMSAKPPKFLSLIPEDAVCQWTLTGMARRWPELRPLARHNIGYLHWCNSSTHTEDDFYLDEVRQICGQAADAGFEGLDTYGELSDQQPNAELFYLAWEAFLWRPDMSREEFVDRRLARVYGGQGPARTLVEILPLVATAKARTQVDKCRQAVGLAKSAKGSASADSHARWDRLLAQLQRFQCDAESRQREQEARQRETRRGRQIQVTAVKASDEDRAKGWGADKAIDGSVDEPAGYWLTQYVHPKKAWIELTLAQPIAVNRVTLFHQLNPAHYRSLDYSIQVRVDGKWTTVAEVRDNVQAGWIAHDFPEQKADAVRLEITRSAYGNRMGVGEIEVRRVP